ncbi:B3 domain-containing transcription factor ABI3-like [Solanum stenotomum]|uniref:B3 domain-containing transcription factor ABI3-like n=1 Tax=Solanum stenotomum TaxID=172797 RepID=UPI0020CFFCBC|nr:B3 domain-containing transcription factor ABI3-like [Solanum stenotomum]
MKRELNEVYYGGNKEDVHVFENINMVPTDFDPMDDTDIWLNGNFSNDFTSLQDFPCMSSSSSTSNSLPTEQPDPSSSWAVQKSDADEQYFDTISDQECLNVMDLIDGDHEFLDPMISFFHSGENQQQKEQANDEQVSIFQGDSELALMFLEWLKQNKDNISAEDMRSIKLKRSTIESASKRLGSTKEGKKQLLRLILDWVEQHRLQKKQMREEQSLQNSAPLNFNNPNACFYNAPFPDSSPVMTGPIQGYIGDLYSNGSLFAPPYNQTMSGSATSRSWSPSQFTMATASQYNPFPDNDSTNNVAIPDQPLFSAQYDPYQVFDGNSERLARLGTCATKEARKNRIARQRRVPLHHYRHQTQNQRQISNEKSVMMGGKINNCAMSRANSLGNWVYWPCAAAAPPIAMVPLADTPQALPMERTAVKSQKHQKHGSTDKRQACKTEKNLKFLLQKVLKQSDVGNLGRIVLPKKEAESHLPQLETRDGISIAMEDIGTSRVWNMKYRFWPNNKSRMYLLENTGDFVLANGLQEGDFIVIYANIKCGKYLIRGVKVRPNGAKSDSTQPAKKIVRKIAAVDSSPFAQAVR